VVCTFICLSYSRTHKITITKTVCYNSVTVIFVDSITDLVKKRRQKTSVFAKKESENSCCVIVPFFLSKFVRVLHLIGYRPVTVPRLTDYNEGITKPIAVLPSHNLDDSAGRLQEHNTRTCQYAHARD
jgi:hypothetical protein